MTRTTSEAINSGALIPQPLWCLRNGVSASTLGKLRAQGLGPKEIRIGTRVYISPEAEAEWRRARENPVGAEAAQIAATAKAMQERGRNAAKKSVASPEHISRHPERRTRRDRADR